MSEFPEHTTLVIDGTRYETRYTRKFALRKGYVAGDPQQVKAHIPGVILKVYVAAGQRVARGEGLVVLEAMKMKNDLTAPHDGVVKAIHVSPGEMAAKGQLLVEFE